MGTELMDQLVQTEQAKQAKAAAGARYGVSLRNGLSVFYKDNTPWMKFAQGELGVGELTNNNDGPDVEKYQSSSGLKSGNTWCGAFVNWCLGQANIGGVNHPGWALNWRNYGQSLNQPTYGSIGTLKRPGGGHVGFVAGLDANRSGWVIMLGGNQSDKVSYQSYPIKIMRFNHPIGYTPSYSLPLLISYPRGVRMQ